MSEALTETRQYTRNDFTALRAFVQRVPAATIGRLYFSEDENGQEWSAARVERYLRDMQADLVNLAIAHGSPVLADHLKASARKHGSAKLTAISLKMVEEASQLAVARPSAKHAVGMWFRPMIARHLQANHIATLGELVAFCNTRGGSWWRSIPRIGRGRAAIMVRWLREHCTTIGVTVNDDVDPRDPLVAADADLIEISPERRLLAPLERMALARDLSGATGLNRSPSFCFIQARHDLEAIRAYLARYRDPGQEKTLLSYTKELERFLLWAVVVRAKPLSSLLVEDCEAYKDWLASPSPAFVGRRAPRTSAAWRPFGVASLSPESRLYAVTVLRAAFEWLVDVRYLAGNPWKAVRNPVTVERAYEMAIDKALPESLMARVRAYIDVACAKSCEKPTELVRVKRWRAARAAVALMADSGLRREELAGARRGALRPSPHATGDSPVWELAVIGKGRKERHVPVSPAAIEAIRAHWADLDRVFEDATNDPPLLSPVTIPNTPRALKKHADGQVGAYSVRAINSLFEWLLKRLAIEMEELSEADRICLHQATPHAFRHSFGTHAAAAEVPPDVIQRAMGHKSLATTSIYVQAEKRRVMQEFGALYQRSRQRDDQ